VGRKGVVDGEVDLGLLRRATAWDRVDSDQGKSKARPERVGRLAGEERKLLGARIWAGWSDRGEFRRAARWSAWWSRGRRKGNNGKERARVGLYRGASLCRREGERESRRAAGLRSTGSADVPFGHAWRPLSTGGSTWQGKGKPAEAARAVGGAARRHVERERATLGQLGLRRTAGEGGGELTGVNRGSRGWRRKMRTDL
jgi:hypothetical protein